MAATTEIKSHAVLAPGVIMAKGYPTSWRDPVSEQGDRPGPTSTSTWLAVAIADRLLLPGSSEYGQRPFFGGRRLEVIEILGREVRSKCVVVRVLVAACLHPF